MGLRRIGQERAYGGHFPRGGRCPKTLASPVCQERAKVGRMKVQQRKAADFLAAISPEEFDEAMSGGDIGPDGMGAPAPIMRQIASPTRR